MTKRGSMHFPLLYIDLINKLTHSVTYNHLSNRFLKSDCQLDENLVILRLLRLCITVQFLAYMCACYWRNVHEVILISLF